MDTGRQGRVFVIVAPSGAGKSSIVHGIITPDASLHFSVSFTSRKPRQGEVNGKDYHFIDREFFEEKIASGDFLEWAEYVGNLYGTDAESTQSLLDKGMDVLMDIDIQGARAVKEKMPGCVRIFILPPSAAELERRLRLRGTNTEAEIRNRLETARVELAEAYEFDFLVVNDNLDKAISDVQSIVTAQRCDAGANRKILDHILHSFE